MDQRTLFMTSLKQFAKGSMEDLLEG